MRSLNLFRHKQVKPTNLQFFRGKNGDADATILTDLIGLGNMNIGGLAMQAFGGAVKELDGKGDFKLSK